VGGKLGKLAIDDVTLTGRVLSVTLKNKQVRADRLALITLVRDLWGDALTKTGRDPRYIVMGDEFDNYVGIVADQGKNDARALYVHIEGPYELPLPKEHRLHELFPKPLFATKGLNEAASAGALVKRALPHARKGTLVDRLAAIRAIDDATWSCSYHHQAEAILAEVGLLVDELARSDSPLLKEASWLLADEHKSALDSMNA
jgi:hypothetical protein